MPESFREFFARRNDMSFPTKGGETTQDVLQRLAETMADWMDELGKRVAGIDTTMPIEPTNKTVRFQKKGPEYAVLHSRSYKTWLMWPRKMTDHVADSPLLRRISSYGTKASFEQEFLENLKEDERAEFMSRYEARLSRVTFEMIEPIPK